MADKSKSLIQLSQAQADGLDLKHETRFKGQSRLFTHFCKLNLTGEMFQIILFWLANRSSKHNYQFHFYNIVILAKKTKKCHDFTER